MKLKKTTTKIVCSLVVNASRHYHKIFLAVFSLKKCVQSFCALFQYGGSSVLFRRLLFRIDWSKNFKWCGFVSRRSFSLQENSFYLEYIQTWRILRLTCRWLRAWETRFVLSLCQHNLKNVRRKLNVLVNADYCRQKQRNKIPSQRLWKAKLLKVSVKYHSSNYVQLSSGAHGDLRFWNIRTVSLN